MYLSFQKELLRLLLFTSWICPNFAFECAVHADDDVEYPLPSSFLLERMMRESGGDATNVPRKPIQRRVDWRGQRGRLYLASPELNPAVELKALLVEKKILPVAEIDRMYTNRTGSRRDDDVFARYQGEENSLNKKDLAVIAKREAQLSTEFWDELSPKLGKEQRVDIASRLIARLRLNATSVEIVSNYLSLSEEQQKKSAASGQRIQRAFQTSLESERGPVKDPSIAEEFFKGLLVFDRQQLRLFLEACDFLEEDEPMEKAIERFPKSDQELAMQVILFAEGPSDREESGASN
ncbi:hypothetical protein [Rubripirellula reticaptiva]|uniref:Uncharacterized protein n=1 Tax=Rubripirellula reticaptiva TaxID=2528013 RepID=A0A5C6EHJ8_9BACT|nr:hypothetical protein [Rubripirellula reticaptiva]TWU48020.1 hypothetical protein Poly59_48640 [Rubripirellula reticaptiva]